MSIGSIYSRPWAVAVSFWVGIIGLPVGIIGLYWEYQSLAARELTCQVDAATTQIVKAGQSSVLTVSYQGKPITTDVTAAQLVLWNADKLSIKPADALKPVVFATRGNIPILEASIRASSRDVIGAALETSEIGKGRLGMKWKILERQDGIRLQIVLAGPTDTKIDIEGVLEG